MPKISYIRARQILDSRGTPTVEVDMALEGQKLVRSSVPSGASTGSYEAVELRDNTADFLGKGVSKAVENINKIIANHIINSEFEGIIDFDKKLINLDSTSNKSKLGANAILACSLSFTKCLAQLNNKELFQSLYENSEYLLPTPLMNIINGGAHANNGLDIQEFMIVPAGFGSFSESLRAGVEIFMNLKKILNNKNYSTAVGDEGGFAPDLKSNEEALDLICEAIEKAGYKIGKDIFLALDVAATELFSDNKYSYNSKKLVTNELIEVYEKLVNEYPIISIEDPLDEDDWDAWSLLTSKIGSKVQLVGDDLFVTNIERLKKGIENKAGNSILVKINQIGSISETIDAINLAKKNHFSYIISHRSGETEDSFIADLAVATGSGQIKTGSCSRTDRTSKYNQLLRIEDLLGSDSKFAGLSTFKIKT
ncbi:MAG: phosphopyruvate hydratase [bacterium]